MKQLLELTSGSTSPYTDSLIITLDHLTFIFILFLLIALWRRCLRILNIFDCINYGDFVIFGLIYSCVVMRCVLIQTKQIKRINVKD